MSLLLRIIIILAITFWFTKVDLKPEISSDYFFSAADPIYQQYQKITATFTPRESLIVIVKSKDYSIQSNSYYREIFKLTNKIRMLKGVETVYSLSSGPKDPIEANENFIWKELIFGESNIPGPNSSTLITSRINKKTNPNVIKDFEKLIVANKSKSFEIRLSGTPYIVEMIKRYFYKDLKVLVLATLVSSLIMLLVLFRSWRILIGALLTSITAVVLSLILMQFFKIPFGILSPNLLIVIFLLTQSHIIFLTTNYFHIGNLDAALKRTFPASLWSMIAVFAGFMGLSMVQAKPLLGFGLGGMIGSFIAIVFAYLLYPVTLQFIHPPIQQEPNALTRKSTITINKPRYLSCLIISSLCVVLGFGIFQFNSDPSIINYFSKGSEARKSMLALDENGGSSTLRLIVSNPYLVYLDNDEAYHALSSLHNELANHKDVGSVMSLALVMKEAKRHWMGKVLPWGVLVNILSGDSYQNIISRFMTHDRRQALFILRMKESEHNKPKAEIIQSIEKIVHKHGFWINYRGGPYSLQHRLSILVKSSLYQSLLYLLVSFSIVVIFVSLNMITSVAVILSVALIMLGALGSICLTGTAIDIISSAALIAYLLLAIDIIIHNVVAIKEADLEEQLRPAIFAILMVSISFVSLYFSEFMPMKHFSLFILIGMVLAGLIIMIVIPSISFLRRSLASKEVT